MRLLKELTTQHQVWTAYRQLDSWEESTRQQAMETLQEAGTASLPCLRLALVRREHPRSQFAASVVLHRLGEPQGMEALLDALQNRLKLTPDIAPELEKALIAIGSPTAVTALLNLWRSLPHEDAHRATFASICRVWAAIRDPRALEGLVEQAEAQVELFEATVPAFGAMATLPLERMTRSTNPLRRLVAVKTLAHLPSPHSFRILRSLLRDPDPQVRGQVPAAMVAISGPNTASLAIQEALKEGYSTREAVETLAVHQAPPYHDLMELVERWDPAQAERSRDTGEAVMVAVSLLAHAPIPWTNEVVFPPLCALLQRRPGPGLAACIARAIGRRGPAGDATDAMARDALWGLLTYADTEARTEAAVALQRFGENLGVEMNQLLEEVRPKERLNERLKTWIKGGPEASQVAAQTMQQVSSWLARASKETLERLNPANPPGAGAALYREPRLLPLLRGVFRSALETLPQISDPKEVLEMTGLCVAVMRVLERIPQARLAQPELIGALNTVKYSTPSTIDMASLTTGQALREVGMEVRQMAAETLYRLYGSDSFPLFLEGVYALRQEVATTALLMLGRLGDARALPHLQPLAADPSHPLQPSAQQALAAIRRAKPEAMTLLRASHQMEAHPETLLRPASAAPSETSPDLLLRPSEPS